ncbi:hypothetical protein Hs30E_18830 [Lactococcus hodotermopsidis]|uniref:Transglutaminase-like domain-containing protein n=2 Tax=Pseudolactococcus hodotermopsidis TaxID=2709157 RepID=A0A6A0BD49_9LACT|nr:hypothetical protein Hs30E_18830 [Lactococcus hodotermopsidis]
MKALSMLCLVAVMGTLFGCSRVEVNNETKVSLFEPRAVGGIDDTLYNAILDREDFCDLSEFQLTEAEFTDGYDLWKIIDDNPAIDYLTNYRWHSTNGIITKVTLEYKNIPADYRTRLEQAVGAAIDSIKKQLQDDYLQSELVCAISDYIVVNCQYAYKADGVTPDNESGSLAYSALVQNRAICDGYASAFSLIASQFEFEVKKISGKSGPNNGSHAWNMVKVDGIWYHVDTTWNDPTPDRPMQAGHDYLLLSDKAIASQRNGSQQYHASWDVNAPIANDTHYDDAFWIFEDEPISFNTLHFDEWERTIAQTTFEDIITTAVESNEDANVARFGYSKDELAAEIKKLYPNIGYTYTMNANDVVIKVGSWKK